TVGYSLATKPVGKRRDICSYVPEPQLHSSGRIPEKAGVGGSTPSLATIIPKDLAKNYVLSSSPLSVRILRGRRNRLAYSNDFEELSANVFFLSPLSVRFGPSRG